LPRSADPSSAITEVDSISRRLDKHPRNAEPSVQRCPSLPLSSTAKPHSNGLRDGFEQQLRYPMPLLTRVLKPTAQLFINYGKAMGNPEDRPRK
jgi:hypothetical protein